ncbi:HepT-like ribonuclease domain-containing protein [Mesorhizobium sp. M7A.F.Ca.MR.176.00.0.0]|uniref:HepT-like ribonuclease domain-containing protein n=1 Tax=Mesorhizobium sp. M7A.F.Ca.MR.176.00.0.0 TaxID=2496776 RepID=UPI0032B18371
MLCAYFDGSAPDRTDSSRNHGGPGRHLAAAAGKTLDDFNSDWLLRHGIERGIEIISEAARHIPDDLAALAPEIPWKQVRGIGNVLRHEYHKTSGAIVWAVVTDSLPPLRLAVERMLEASQRR